MYIYIYMYVCMYVCRYVRTYVRTYVLCMYVCILYIVCMYIVYIYICMYIYIYHWWAFTITHVSPRTLVPAPLGRTPIERCPADFWPRFPARHGGYPNSWTIYNGKSHLEMDDDWGVALFWETSNFYLGLWIVSVETTGFMIPLGVFDVQPTRTLSAFFWHWRKPQVQGWFRTTIGNQNHRQKSSAPRLPRPRASGSTASESSAESPERSTPNPRGLRDAERWTFTKSPFFSTASLGSRSTMGWHWESCWETAGPCGGDAPSGHLTLCYWEYPI